jgi:hypothetical protein
MKESEIALIDTMREMIPRLQAEFQDYRSIWVDVCTYKGFRMCITLFPNDNSPYRMFFGPVNQVTYENVRSIILSNLAVSN